MKKKEATHMTFRITPSLRKAIQKYSEAKQKKISEIIISHFEKLTK